MQENAVIGVIEFHVKLQWLDVTLFEEGINQTVNREI